MITPVMKNREKIKAAIEKVHRVFAARSGKPLVWRGRSFYRHYHIARYFLVREILRVLRPGGKVLVETPNIVDLRKRIYILAGISFMPRIEYVYEEDFHSEHHREYTMTDLKKVLNWSGFDLIEGAFVDTFWKLSLKTFKGVQSNGLDPENKSVFLNWIPSSSCL